MNIILIRKYAKIIKNIVFYPIYLKKKNVFKIFYLFLLKLSQNLHPQNYLQVQNDGSASSKVI